jgi:hypothetical protein
MASATAIVPCTCELCGQPRVVSAESLKRDVSADRWRPTTLGQRLYADWKARKQAERAELDRRAACELRADEGYAEWARWLETRGY